MTFAPATIAPMKYLRAKQNVSFTDEHNCYSYHNPHIKLNLKPYHNPNPNPDSLENLRPEQLSPEQMTCNQATIRRTRGCLWPVRSLRSTLVIFFRNLIVNNSDDLTSLGKGLQTPKILEFSLKTAEIVRTSPLNNVSKHMQCNCYIKSRFMEI